MSRARQPNTEKCDDRAVQQHRSDERATFQALVSPYADELLRAARREIAYRCAVGDLTPDAITPEDLVGDTLIRAWQDRHRRPASLGVRPWLIGLLYRAQAAYGVSRSIVGRGGIEPSAF